MICKDCGKEIIIDFKVEMDVEVDEVDITAKCDCGEVSNTCFDLEDLQIFLKGYVLNRVVKEVGV